ncbi:MAG: lipocalin-like domain-containing protein [Thermoanaerobaculia bacterium]|nr:lipocalin-like domain-containing protein [Thermoanaerobaculia bacterium]
MLTRLLILLLLTTTTAAQDRVDSKGFDIAEPGWDYRFPRDHGSHEEFRTEWWYFTGHLWDEAERRYGFELTFFRVGVNPPEQRSPGGGPWALDDIALAHFAVTDLEDREFIWVEKLNRSSPFTAEAKTGSLEVFNEGWRVAMQGDRSIRLSAQSENYDLDLRLEARKPPAIHGENGISVKGKGVGYSSHYYSLSRLRAEGSLRDGERLSEVSGIAWMDHEFGSAILREDQEGWDWFSIQLDDDTELMLYQIRRQDGSPDTTSSGSFIAQDGSVIHLDHHQFSIEPVDEWTSPRSGGTYPMGWIVQVPSLGIRLAVEETMRPQELVTEASTDVVYWEGAVNASGRSGANAVRGYGYVEMTGYAGAIENLQ